MRWLWVEQYKEVLQPFSYFAVTPQTIISGRLTTMKEKQNKMLYFKSVYLVDGPRTSVKLARILTN